MRHSAKTVEGLEAELGAARASLVEESRQLSDTRSQLGFATAQNRLLREQTTSLRQHLADLSREVDENDERLTSAAKKNRQYRKLLDASLAKLAVYESEKPASAAQSVKDRPCAVVSRMPNAAAKVDLHGTLVASPSDDSSSRPPASPRRTVSVGEETTCRDELDTPRMAAHIVRDCVTGHVTRDYVAKQAVTRRMSTHVADEGVVQHDDVVTRRVSTYVVPDEVSVKSFDVVSELSVDFEEAQQAEENIHDVTPIQMQHRMAADSSYVIVQKDMPNSYFVQRSISLEPRSYVEVHATQTSEKPRGSRKQMYSVSDVYQPAQQTKRASGACARRAPDLTKDNFIVSFAEDELSEIIDVVKESDIVLKDISTSVEGTGRMRKSNRASTSSLAGLKASRKNGLVAFVRDIEQKFRKRRRSKTIDLTEFCRHRPREDSTFCST